MLYKDLIIILVDTLFPLAFSSILIGYLVTSARFTWSAYISMNSNDHISSMCQICVLSLEQSVKKHLQIFPGILAYESMTCFFFSTFRICVILLFYWFVQYTHINHQIYFYVIYKTFQIILVGCEKGMWRTNCSEPCSSVCIDQHCHPGNGSCVWGVTNRNV